MKELLLSVLAGLVILISSPAMIPAMTPVTPIQTYNGVTIYPEDDEFLQSSLNPIDDPTDPVDTLWWTGNIDLHIFGGQAVGWHPDLPQLAGVYLQIKYGLWNSPPVRLRITLNGSLVGQVLANLGYISPGPKYATFNITNYIIPGTDSIMVTALDGGEAVIGYMAVGVRVADWDAVDSPENRIYVSDFKLLPPSPNPFNQHTNLTFSLPEAGETSLVIFNLQGREVAILLNDWRSAGEHSLVFDASRLSSGIYFVSLTFGNARQTRKLLLIK